MSPLHELVRLGQEASELEADVKDWASGTFGTAQQRGPVGPLHHLAKEANETAEDPTNIVEYADCLIIFLDAMWRAGFTLQQVVDAAHSKMKVNRARKWPKAVEGKPCEHIKEVGGQPHADNG